MTTKPQKKIILRDRCQPESTITLEEYLYYRVDKARIIAGTNLLHSLSYPLTGHYGVSHGLALGYFLPKISDFMMHDVDGIISQFSNFTIDFDIDLEMVVDEALKYDKIYECNIFIDKSILMEVLK